MFLQRVVKFLSKFKDVKMSPLWVKVQWARVKATKCKQLTRRYRIVVKHEIFEKVVQCRSWRVWALLIRRIRSHDWYREAMRSLTFYETESGTILTYHRICGTLLLEICLWLLISFTRCCSSSCWSLSMSCLRMKMKIRVDDTFVFCIDSWCTGHGTCSATDILTL